MRMRKARIKIDKTISRCVECPFIVMLGFSGVTVMTPPFREAYLCSCTDKRIYDLLSIPDWCPFLVAEKEGIRNEEI